MPLLTKAEIATCKESFQQLAGSNGLINSEHLRQALANEIGAEAADELVDLADSNKNGHIEFGEFLRIADSEVMAAADKDTQNDDDFERHTKRRTTKLKKLLPGVKLHKNCAIVQHGREVSFSAAKSGIENAFYGENDEHKICCFCVPILDPDGMKEQIWQLLIAGAIIYAAIMTPFLLAFQDLIVREGYPGAKTVLIVDNAVNVVFMVDIVFQFCMAYPDEKGVMISNPRKIAKKYIKTWFFPDLISCVPLDIIVSEDFMPGLYLKITRMGKFTRIFRLLKVVKILKLVRLIKFWKRFDEIFMKWVSNDQYEANPSKGYQFGKFVVCAILVAHVCGCVWYAVADLHEDRTETWLASFDVLEDDVPLLDKYLASLYFIITTLTTVGYGDISASTTAEIVVCICLEMGGVLGYSLAVGTVSTALMQEDQRVNVLNSKLGTLSFFAKTTNMDVSEYRKIKSFVIAKYTDSLDWMMHLSGPAKLQELLQDLPVVLRAKMLRCMHDGKHLDLDFFKTYADEDFFSYVAPLLSSAQFEIGDIMYVKGDYAERVYFLTHGTAAFIDADVSQYQSKNLKSKGASKSQLDLERALLSTDAFQVVVDGSTIGEFEVLLSMPRQLCVRSEMKSDCLALHKRDLLRVLAEFPTIAVQMERDAKAEYIATMRRKAAASGRGIDQEEVETEAHELFLRHGNQTKANLMGGQSSAKITFADSRDGANLGLGKSKSSVTSLPRGQTTGSTSSERHIDVEPVVPLESPSNRLLNTKAAICSSPRNYNPDLARELRLESRRAPGRPNHSDTPQSGLTSQEYQYLEKCQSQVHRGLQAISGQHEMLERQVDEIRNALLGIDLRIQSLVLQ